MVLKKENSKIELIFAIVFLAAVAVLLYHVIKEKQEKERFVKFVGSGESMEPTFHDGDVLLVDSKAKVYENDIIVFQCLKCQPSVAGSGAMTKRVVAIDERGCYWLEGDNRQISFDSRDDELGWLCPSEIKVFGVVKKIVKD